MTRYSIKTALAFTRGARSATGRARVKYGRSDAIAMRLTLALKRLNDAEAELLAAMRLARHGVAKREAA